jgi:hypothetical protein
VRHAEIVRSLAMNGVGYFIDCDGNVFGIVEVDERAA